MLLGGLFTYQNNQVVDIHILQYQWQVNLTLLLLSVLICGIVLGCVISFFQRLRLPIKLSMFNKKVYKE